MCYIGDDPLKVALASKVFDVRAGQWVTEERLGKEKNKGLAELSVHLTSEDVEDVGRAGEVGDLHVAVLVLAVEFFRRWEDSWVFVHQLQVTLHSSTAVFRTLTVVTVRKREYESRALKPLDFTTCNELIDDDYKKLALGYCLKSIEILTLSGIGKITELSFPDDKSVWR